ncbi:MAG: cytochrome c oxidase subunit 3 [Lewinellaceae bacterium]|nr:cytochrome c oxidase subunit 3 [Saprospiraceae bacterium]MCB9340793.1 cytochrome c oxidase subunit 3 [Lewinellaceae bacterium]
MQQTKQQESHYSEYDNLAFHPWNVMLMLTLFAIVALFLATSIAFIYNRVQNDTGTLAIPWLFGFNTLILLGSSWTMWRAKKAYEGDNTSLYQRCLLATIFLSLLFLGMQFVAWSQLFAQNVFVNTNNSASYLYVLSGLHFAHVIAGLPFLILFLRAARLQMKEPVTVLVYFSDPEKRLKLRLLSIYWHFLDALWVFLVLFLLANYLIR